MLEQITPLILTYNEAPNIGRVLDRLRWARRVVVVDSFSTDATEAIAARYPNVVFYRRPFDNHANQWNHGLRETAIDTGWVLALDADYVVSEALIHELRTLNPSAEAAGYQARFRYCIDGVPLKGTVYTPVTILFRRERATYVQKGHTQRVLVSGGVAALRAPIFHDDRKTLERWFTSQVRYMRLESEALLGKTMGALDLPDRVRRLLVVAPLAIFLYCLLAKLAILDGRRGLLYACQRALAEAVLSVFLVQGLIERGAGKR